MPFIFKRLALFLSIAAAFAADKDEPFRPGPVTSFAHRQTSQNVTIAVDPYDSGDKVKAAFGKLDPYEHGVLPVLVVIQNDSAETLRMANLQVQYSGPNRSKVTATPAKDVKYLRSPGRPKVLQGPPGQVKVIGKKNPLSAWEIEGRAMAATMIPPGNNASGFYYFDTALQRGATIYISGLQEARTGKDLFYFEIPLN